MPVKKITSTPSAIMTVNNTVTKTAANTATNNIGISKKKASGVTIPAKTGKKGKTTKPKLTSCDVDNKTKLASISNKSSKPNKPAKSNTTNKKKDKLSYNGSVGAMDIMAEFSQSNKNIIVKFPTKCINNISNIGELEYTPEIHDPMPYNDMNKLSHPLQRQLNTNLNSSIGAATNDINFIMEQVRGIPDGSTSVEELRQEIYDNYITAGSNATLTFSNLLSTQNSLVQQHQQVISGIGNIPLNTNSSQYIASNDPQTINNNNNNNNVAHNTSANNHIGTPNTNKTGPVTQYQRKIDELLSEFTTPDKKRPMTQIEILLHKKYNQTKQIELMHSMCSYVKTQQQWPKSCNSACLWDCHDFPYMPWGIPESYDIYTGTFNLYGVFCSPNCALAYLMKEERNIGTMWEKVSLLNLLYHIIYNGTSTPNNDELPSLVSLHRQNKAKNNVNKYDNKWGYENLVPAPDRMTLNKFGGPLTIEQFRCLTINNDKQYHIVFPPCNFVSHILEESKTVFTNDNNFIPLGSNYFNKMENELKIKRSKPISAPRIKTSREKWPSNLRKQSGIMRDISGQAAALSLLK